MLSQRLHRAAVSALCCMSHDGLAVCRTREKSARTHTAMSDIKASLEELRWYKRQVFKTPAQLSAAARPEALQQGP